MSYRDNSKYSYGQNRDGYRRGGGRDSDRNYYGSQSGWNHDSRNRGRGRGRGGTSRHSGEEERRRQYERRHQDRDYGSSGHYRPKNQRIKRTRHEYNDGGYNNEDSSNKAANTITKMTNVPRYQDEMKRSNEHHKDLHAIKKEREYAMEVEETGSVVKEVQSIKDSWFVTPLDTKIVSQLSDGMAYQIVDDMKQLKEGTPLVNKEEWMEKKVKAAKRALADIKASFASPDPDSDSDSDSDYPYGDKALGGDRYVDDMYPASALESFISHLPYNIIFDSGFLVPGVHPEDENHCYCPCSKYMRKWRETFRLCDPEGKDKCTNFRKGSPNALMGHLKDNGGILHWAIKTYLKYLYEKYWDRVTEGVDHKGLHNPGDKSYKKAVSAEKKHYVEAMEHYRSVLEMKDQELEREKKKTEELAKVEKISKERADDLKNLQEAYERLSVKKEEKIKEEPDPKESMKKEELLQKQKEEELNAFSLPTRALICNVRDCVTGEIREKDKVVIETQAKIDIQDLFNQWYEAGEKDKTFLFRELTRNQERKVLWPWNVKIGTAPLNPEIRGNRKIIKDLSAIDEGGPTRALISAFDDEMGGLSVTIMVPEEWIKDQSKTKFQSRQGKAEIKANLFTIQKESYVPVRDVAFEKDISLHVIQNKQKDATEMLVAKSKKFYRAIGRMIAHIICQDQIDNTVFTISTKLMPKLVRNALLRNMYPESSYYPEEDLFNDLQGMGETLNVEKSHTFGLWGMDDDFLQKYDPSLSENDVIGEKFKAKFVSLFVLKSRDIALSSLKEGLTLNGKFNLLFLLSLVPSRVVNTMLFSNPNIKAEDVISVLRPDYTDLTDDEKVDKDSAVSIRKIQQHCFEKRLPEVIKQLSIESSDNNFLSNFLSFCTGCSYLPCKEIHPAYSIVVGFEKEFNDEDLPTTNSCVNRINLPMYAYNFKEESALKEKLSKAVEWGCKTFGLK